MFIAELSAGKKVVGLNQTKKAISNGIARKVYIARDADDMFSTQVKQLCGDNLIPLEEELTMGELGKACGIDVDCAVCAIVSD